jgi:hypothetical protein
LAQGRSCNNQIANSFKCHKSDILCLTLVEKEERLADLANAASGSTHPVTTPEVGVFGAEVHHKVDAGLIIEDVDTDALLEKSCLCTGVVNVLQQRFGGLQPRSRPRASALRASAMTTTRWVSSSSARVGAPPRNGWIRSRPTNLFLDALLRLPGWDTIDPWVAAQRVQRSAFEGRPLNKGARACHNPSRVTFRQDFAAVGSPGTGIGSAEHSVGCLLVEFVAQAFDELAPTLDVRQSGVLGRSPVRDLLLDRSFTNVRTAPRGRPRHRISSSTNGILNRREQAVDMVDVRAVAASDERLEVSDLLGRQGEVRGGLCHQRLDVTLERCREQDRGCTGEGPTGTRHTGDSGRCATRATCERHRVLDLGIDVGKGHVELCS